MKALFFAVLAAVSARAEDPACVKTVTPEALIEHQFGPRIPQLYDYAACAELQARKAYLCDYFPGGSRSLLPGNKAPRPYTYPAADGTIHTTDEYSVCDSRSAGYLILSQLLKGSPRSEMLPLVKRMLNSEKSLSAEEVLDAYVSVFKKRSLEGTKLPKLVRLGFFHHVLGEKACREAPFENIRKECLAKAAALEALKAGDDRLCVKDDLMCLALVRGARVCEAPASQAVRKFCKGDFQGDKPDWRHWELKRRPRL